MTIFTDTDIKRAFNIPQSITLPTITGTYIFETFMRRKRLNTNNWRKLHGMAMKRRGANNDSKAY
nr:MAG TPA: hypothetical protein [Caudoviricetes sp.]